MTIDMIRRQLLLTPELEIALLRYQDRLAKQRRHTRVTWQDCAREAIRVGLAQLDGYER